MANASTPGYSRQQATLSTTTPASAPSANLGSGPGQIGTGVHVSEIKRVRDGFLDYQVRPQLSQLGYWEEGYEALTSVEAVMMEPGENGLNNMMDRFWDSWQELAKNPTSGAARAATVETAETLTSSFNNIASQLETLQTDLRVKTEFAVNDINSIASQVAALNEQIVPATGAGLNANDLMDQRDLLLDDLARLTNFTALVQTNGSVDISIKGRFLVQESRASQLEARLDNGVLEVGWVGGVDFQPDSGRVAGINAVRDRVDAFYSDLNSMVTTLMDRVNEVHQAGDDLAGNTADIDFFVQGPLVPGDRLVRFIKVNPDIVTDPNLVRASLSGSADGSNARNIYAIRHESLSIAGTETSLQSFYNGITSDLTVDAQQAERMTLNQEVLTAQIVQRRDDVSGVSIDEEMSNMLQFQRAYQAAAKLLSVLDEILSVTVNLGR